MIVIILIIVSVVCWVAVVFVAAPALLDRNTSVSGMGFLGRISGGCGGCLPTVGLTITGRKRET